MRKMTDFFQCIENHIEIKNILKKYEVQYEDEKDLEFFDELQNGILEDYPNISNLEIVLQRIVIYLTSRDLCL
jgi:predicted HAD superfamily hydrolase